MPGSSIWSLETSSMGSSTCLPPGLGDPSNSLLAWVDQSTRSTIIAVYLPLCPAREIEGKVWGTSSHFIESSADALQLYP